MGQAVMDLPDPLDSKRSASAEGADDLLSQMAGAEIDRLLAEAEAADAGSVGDGGREDALAELAGGSQLVKPRDTPVPTAAIATAPRDSAVSSFVADGDATLEAELDKVFDRMTASPKEPPAAERPAPLEAPTEAPTPSTTESPTPGGSIDLLNVLGPLIAEDAAKSEAASMAPDGDEPAAPDQDVPPAQERVPIFVRALEWINAPMAWLPPAARDAAGKIGILTFVNAAAILLYVLFFRRK